MTHNSVLSSFESLWHYGLPYASPLHITSSIAITPPNHTHTSCCSASSLVANESSVSSRVGPLQSLFSVMDEDGDGQLTLCEMRSLLTKLGISSQSTDLESFITHEYTSSTLDGFSLDFPQFTQFYASLFSASHNCSTQDPVWYANDDCFDDELLDAFRVYDTNHDGFISAAELATVLRELGLLPDRCGIDAHLGRCQAYIDSVDLDGNGMVDLGEFKSMMTQHSLSTPGFSCSSFSQCN